MIMCEQAEFCPYGYNYCCVECRVKDICKDACADLSKNCPDAYLQSDALTTMKKESAELIQCIADLTIQKKQIDDQEKAMRKQLLAAMEKYGVKSFESDKVKFVYVAPTTRTTIDSTKLKQEMPKIAEKYSKTSPVSASVKITVKE